MQSLYEGGREGLYVDGSSPGTMLPLYLNNVK